MPWSAKAQELLKQQYAAVGAAARASLKESASALESARQRGLEPAGLRERTLEREVSLSRYVDAYRRYCWPVRSVLDLKLAPFHFLAAEGKVHLDRDHAWHMDTLAKLSAADREALRA